MLRNTICAVTVLSLLLLKVTVSVDEKASEYIQSIIKLHSSIQFGPHPLPLVRRCVSLSSEKNGHVPHCKYPLIIIWEPEVQFSLVFPDGIKCDEKNCGGTLRASFWNDGSSDRKNPRTIHHCNEVYLIVSRNYVCEKNSKHCFGGTHPSILKQFPDPTLIPFVLLHKAGVTRDLLYQIPKLVNAGLSFVERELFLTELRREQHFHRFLTKFPKQSGNNITTDYVDVPLSNDVLTHFYIEYFRENEEYLNREMMDLTASWLTCDHTFKVASNIGLMPGGKWVKQYDSLFAVMNELGQVVTWQFVYGQSYSTIETLLTSLKKRLDKKGCTLQGICIDNCCHWGKKLENTFGPGVQVKLDIFHAVQRIGLAMSKKHPFYWRCLRDFSQIFRQPGDNGDQRHKETPAPDVIRQNLNKFVSKWRIVKYKDMPVLTEKALKEISKLEKHIDKGCLSYIPSGIGTNKNENMHRSLNKDLKKNRIGVMLALAILTQFFYCLNQRKSNTDTKKGSIPPTISPAERKAHGNSPPTASEKENFGIGINKRNVTDENGGNAFQTTDSSSEDIMVILYKQREHNSTKTRDDSQERREPIDDSVALDEDCLSDILYRSLCMLQIGETISNLSKSNSFNIRDLGFMDNVFQTLHASDSNENEGGENQRRLDSVLESYGFARCPVLGDGDCLLTTLLNHLSCIGLTPTTVISQPVSKLRKLVAEWLENEDYYGLRYLCLNEHDIISYEENGVYGGALGDAMPLALANVLQLPTILFTSIENFPVVVVSPRQQVPDAQPLFLAYQQQGPGHYDIAEFQQAPATSSTPQPEIVEKDLTLPEIQSCRCGQGRDRKDLTKMRCQIPPGKYSSRCECFNNKAACSSSCQCKNCSNIYGRRPDRKAGDVKQPQKREKHDAQMNQQTSISFMEQRGERVREGGWTNKEHCVFVHSLKFVEENETATVKKLHHVYNSLVQLINQHICLAKKSEKEIAAKYTQHCKEAALIQSLLK